MKKINFSVVIPAYNSSQTICRAVESVLKQSYPVKEIIVVDDFSNDFDELKSNLSKLMSDKIKIIRHHENKFGGAARNTGINSSLGEWIAFLDSDDYWEPNKIFEVAKRINEDNDNYIVYYSRLLKGRYNKGSQLMIPKQGIMNGESVSEYLFYSNGLIQTSTIVCSKQVLDVVKFNPALKRHQDYDLCLRLEKVARFEFIPLTLCYWVQSGKDVSSKGASATFSSNWLEQYKTYFSQKALLGFKIKVLCPLYVRDNDYLKIIMIFLSALKKLEIRLLVVGSIRVIKALIKSILKK